MQAFIQFPENFVKEIADLIIQGIISQINSKTMKEEKLMTRKELATHLDVCEATITNYKRDGLPFLEVKSRPYFKISEVEKYMIIKKKKA